MGKPDAPSGPSEETLLEISASNIESNEKLFEDYMAWQRDQSQAQQGLQEDFQALAEREFEDQEDLSERRMALLEQTQGSQDRYLDQAYDFAEKQEARADEQFGLFMDQAEGQAELSELQRERYQELAIPERDEYISQLRGWDTAARRDDRAAAAVADVATANEAKRQNSLRRLESYGIDPSQTRSAALDRRLGVQSAVAEGAAATGARREVEREGLQYGGEAVNLRAGLPSSSAAALSAGSGAAQGAFGTASSAQQGQTNAYRAGMQGAGTLNSMIGSQQQGGLGALEMAGSQITNNYRNQLSGFQTASNMIGQNQNMALGTYGAQTDKYSVDAELYPTELANSPLNTAIGIAGTAVPFLDDGGYIDDSASPSRGAIPDDVPAMVSAGEVVLPEDVVRYHGLKTFNKMHKEAKENMGIPEEGA